MNFGPSDEGCWRQRRIDKDPLDDDGGQIVLGGESGCQARQRGEGSAECGSGRRLRVKPTAHHDEMMIVLSEVAGDLFPPPVFFRDGTPRQGSDRVSRSAAYSRNGADNVKSYLSLSVTNTILHFERCFEGMGYGHCS